MNENERYAWERILLGKEEARHRKRVRARQKYLFWQKIWKEIQGARNSKDLMWIVFNAIDSLYGWGYCTQAIYAEEALTLFLQDIEGIESQSKVKTWERKRS